MKRQRQSKPPDRDDRRHLDHLLDEALADTFPASDPVAIDVETPPKRGTSKKRTK
jgi:hypothetical protein